MNCLKPFQMCRESLKSSALKKESRLLGLDVGDKYIGLAISDTDCRIASPLSVLVRTNTNIGLMADDFLQLISAFSVEGFVVGYPYRKNKNTADAFQVQDFVNRLNKTGKLEGVNYTLWNECFTSRSIKIMLDPLKLHPVEYKTAIDKFAAVNILQGYLDYAIRESKIQDQCK